MTGLFSPFPDETRRIINRLPELIDKTFPLPGRFRAALPRDVAELSRLLTSGREDRGASYLGKPALLSAYLRYFLPWNVYRLSRLLSSGDSLGSSLPLNLKPNDAINDLGAGPLTLALSLWISRPDLRNVPLEFRCVDRTAAVLDAGKKLFAVITAGGGVPAANAGTACPWIIKTIRGELRRGSLSVEIRGKPAALSAAVNVYNELFWDLSPHDTNGLGRFAENHARLLSSLTESSGSVLVVEPGIPRSGEFTSLLRSALIKEGRTPLSPCVHSGPCPLPGGKMGKNSKAKWCHFAFGTEDAPEALHKLSAAAAIPKERAVLSFILTGPAPAEKAARKRQLTKIRIISDTFPAKDSWGRYGCSERGLVLVTGNKKNLENSPSGTLKELPLIDGLKDEKSGALVAGLSPR